MINSLASFRPLPLSKKSSFIVIVPISIEKVSTTFPFSIRAISLEPPPISTLIALSIGRRFFVAKADKKASLSPLITLIFILRVSRTLFKN